VGDSGRGVLVQHRILFAARRQTIRLCSQGFESSSEVSVMEYYIFLAVSFATGMVIGILLRAR
jgi:hypothetical protein